MPATAKRGFRLPWMRDRAGADAVSTRVLDGRADDAASPESDSATGPEAEALDDLGSGPFGIAPAPRDLLRDLDPVPDLESQTTIEPGAGTSMSHEPHGEGPNSLRQAAYADDAPGAEPSPPANVRPGISVAPGTSTDSTHSVAHEGAPASAWPEADLAARAAVASSLAALESDPQTQPAGADESAAQAGGPTSSAAEPEPVGASPKSAPQRSTHFRAGASAPPAVQPMHERRVNPLLTGLVKAMRDSARTTREETSARLRVEAEARVVVLRSRAAADAVALRTQAEEDVAGIREWSKAETARIRVEMTQRIDLRRNQLTTDSHALSSQRGRLVTEIEAAVATFEAEMKRFFRALLAEEDPAKLATLAERMPEPPVLEALPEAVAAGIDDVASSAKARASRAAAKHVKAAKRADGSSAARAAAGGHAAARSHRRSPWVMADDGGGGAGGAAPRGSIALDPETAALAEAEALAGLDLLAMAGPDRSHDGTESSSNGASPLEGTRETREHENPDETPHEATEETADATTDETRSVLTDASTPAEGPEAEFVIEGQTRLIVGRLGDGGVAAFAAALRDVTGVGSVNVSPGDEGQVVFSVTHRSDTDLRAAVPELAGFRAHVTADEGAILSVAAQDPR